MAFLAKLFGDANARVVRSFEPIVERINALEPEFHELSDEALREKTATSKSRLTAGESVDDLLPEAFAAVREAALRALNQRHFDVQLMGGIALHRGAISEMRTGEGKTLVATLPLYLNSLAGKGCHLVTTNDYLARVGGGWMGPVYHALGVSVGVICHDSSAIYDPAYRETPSHGDERLDHWRPCSRREAYEADITYGTNNEFGFDYLRDNMAYSPADMRQRYHEYAIVDEVDSILIDEARTPLIISAPDQESAGDYQVFAKIVPNLKENEHYNIDAKLRAVTITEAGIDKVESLLGVGDIYAEKGFRYVHYLEQALRAHVLFQRDKDYVVRNGEVVIVDEFTGRMMPGRRWSEGLHQSIEAKEGVMVQPESRTLATITFQNYFRLYRKIAGMTGTAVTSAEEFHKVYSMDVVSIPTNKPMVRRDFSDLIFRTEHGKFLAVLREIKRRNELGQPLLIGTVSIEKNERLAEYLKKEGVPHRVLNAKNHEEEAKIIAQAGRVGAVTIATNMAGRGVDILLGGTPQDIGEANQVRELGGLHVIGTERHEARRIDNQLRGRSGRQGDPGSSQFFLSLEDELMRIFGSERIKSMMESFGIPEDEPIENRMVSRAIESAQEKIEGFHFDARKHILEYDDVMNKQRGYVYRLRLETLENAERAPDALAEELAAMIREEAERLASFHTAAERISDWNIKEIGEDVRAIAEVPSGFSGELIAAVEGEGPLEDKRDQIRALVRNSLLRVLDERRVLLGDQVMQNAVRVVMLQSIDMLWVDHLDQMEHLRDSVRLRAYGQHDPLVEYKHEGARLFRDLQAAVRAQIVNTIFKVGLSPERREARSPASPRNLVFKGAAADTPQAAASRPSVPIPKKSAVKRNDPCPCGATNPKTGNAYKYKNCGLINASYHRG